MSELQQPTITTVPAKVQFDFNQYRDELVQYIADYNIVVTDENLADAKKAATELNKLSAAIKAGFKANIDELKKPAVELTGYSKELESICQEGRSNILQQVEKFESVRKELAANLLKDFREELWQTYGVSDGFKRAEFDDLILLGSLTANNKLTKGASEKLEARVKDDAMKQQTIALRHSELVTKSINAGLRVPIESRHVEAFIHLPDAEYNQQLDKIIQAEVERQQKSDEIAKKHAEEEAQREEQRRLREQRLEQDRLARQSQIEERAELDNSTPEQAAENLANEEEAADSPATSNREPVTFSGNTKVVTVIARYSRLAPAHVPNSVIANRVREKLIQVGYQPDSVECE